jgi:TldD protein
MEIENNYSMKEILENVDTIYEEVSTTLSEKNIGELYISNCKSNNIRLIDGKVQTVGARHTGGFSIRSIHDKKTILTSQNNLKVDNILAECRHFRSFAHSKGQKKHFSTLATRNLYDNYFIPYDIKSMSEFLRGVSDYVKANCKYAQKVLTSFSTKVEEVLIITSEGKAVYDFRPVWVMMIWNSLKNGGEVAENRESFSLRNQISYAHENWKRIADQMIRANEVLIHAKKATGGKMPVIFGTGGCGVLLHEAIGHGLEADFNMGGYSVFSGKIGQKIASEHVTVVDDGTIPNARGSLNFDDEGTETQKNVLVKDGILQKYLSDKYNAREMGVNSTGSGRRQSFDHKVIPRMNTTYMESGNAKLDDMISSIKKGVYAKSFSHGQVEISSGQFAFSGSEMYAIENGKITYPIKGCTFSGMGGDVMKNIELVGSSFAMDEDGGLCGKNFQTVPVGMGLPDILVNNIVVGG